MPTAILRARQPENLNFELKYHHLNDSSRHYDNRNTASRAGRPAGRFGGGGFSETDSIRSFGKGRERPAIVNNSSSSASIKSQGRPRAKTTESSRARRIVVDRANEPRSEPRHQRCEPTTSASNPNTPSTPNKRTPTKRRPSRAGLQPVEVEKPPAVPRLVTFTGTRTPLDMPIMMVDQYPSVHTAVGGARPDDVVSGQQYQHHMALGGDRPGGGVGVNEFADYRNENYNLNTNYHDQARRMHPNVNTNVSSSNTNGEGSNRSNSGGNGSGNAVRKTRSSPTSPAVLNPHAFPPRRDSKKGTNPLRQQQHQQHHQHHQKTSPPPKPQPPTTSSPAPGENHTTDTRPSWPADWPLEHQHPRQPRPYPLQRQLSHPNAPPRRTGSPGRPPTAGSNYPLNYQNPSDFEGRAPHGNNRNNNPHTALHSFRSLEHMSNASPQRSSPIPFETPNPASRSSSRPPPNGPPSAGPFQNSQPKGLRVRTGPTPPLTHSQNRGKPGPDQRYPTDRNGRHPEEATTAGMRSPIIQMPLAFNKIATTRQEQSRSSSPTTNRSPIESFHSSLPNIRPAGRRPTILREEVSPEHQHQQQPKSSSPRGTSESLAMSRHDEVITERPPSVPRKQTPPPSAELRQKRSQSPFPDASKFSESPSAVRGSFRSALQKTGVDDQKDGIRSSVATNNSATTTTSASETGDISGEMSVEDAIGMYESDDDDWDPTEVPVIDRQKRTDSGTPLEGHQKVSMKEDRMSRSGLADFLIKQREEAASPSSPLGEDDAGVSLFLENGINLEAELLDAQNNEWQAITDKRKSIQVETPPTPEPENEDDNNNVNGPAPEDTPPRYPPMKPAAPRDRYGFRTETQYITAVEYNAWNSKYEEILTRRKKKWQHLLKEAGLTPLDNELPVRFPPRSQKVKRFVRKGIPPEWRGNAWWFYANGQKYITKNPGLYEKLVAQGAPTDSEAPELIERDLHRTHPDNIHFKPEQKYPLANGSKLTKHKQSNSKIVETPIIQSLRRVLTAFAVYVPRIGYCQSLNFWAGMLLLFMDEEKSFWMLYIITHQYLPGTHERSLEGSNIDQAVLMMAVKDAMPHVWAKISLCLDGTSVNFNNSKLPDITLCTASWLMSGFISNLPIESVLRVWDAFFYEGSKILFRVSLGLFKIAEPAIKAVGDPVEVFQIVQTTPRKCVDAGALMDLCFKRRNGYGHLSQDDIENRRRERKDLLDREKKAVNDGGRRSSKDDLLIRKGFAHHLLEEGEESVRRFRHFIKLH
ncbi:hypothetical protein H072_80 [Dactylellina haptotyla CBS 200.50]|uniref:Rab-GAP TBC domain-containing protein n=1 Tax=Dactylellina haptotyla (strain CBS 200.50) TaxID=1284197 RepID=S8CE45_DACHA|nr:hypothetical protein H072_80 [Dactylellina haptotyla CBS 200.50]